MDSELGMKAPRRLSQERRGFTLVELLVVLALIALLSAGIGLAFTGRDSAARLQTSESTMAGLFQRARIQAVRLHVRTRVIVLDDPMQADDHRSAGGVVCEDPRRPGAWRAVGSPLRLPSGIHFWPERSRYDGRFQVRFPMREAQEEGVGRWWYYYEFDARGRLAAQERRTFVMGASFRERGPESPAALDETTPMRGFAIHPLGGLDFPKNPEALR